jgi:GNAT superfamily N-acetyltransferase
MQIRPATIGDIDNMHRVRMSVRENVLKNPRLVTHDDYVFFLTHEKGWVCEMKGEMAGFAIIDVTRKNIWALFVDPGFEKKGIGKQLQQAMMDWYFQSHDESVKLNTAPGTRAEDFYRKSGWKETGRDKNGEVLFEMDKLTWQS